MPPHSVPARGIISQPSISATLMRVEAIARGSKIWVEDDEQVWLLAEVVRQDNTILTVREKRTGLEKEIDLVRDQEKVWGWLRTLLSGLLLAKSDTQMQNIDQCHRPRLPYMWGTMHTYAREGAR